jgi:hypothetical protein
MCANASASTSRESGSVETSGWSHRRGFTPWPLGRPAARALCPKGDLRIRKQDRPVIDDGLEKFGTPSGALKRATGSAPRSLGGVPLGLEGVPAEPHCHAGRCCDHTGNADDKAADLDPGTPRLL